MPQEELAVGTSLFFLHARDQRCEQDRGNAEMQGCGDVSGMEDAGMWGCVRYGGRRDAGRIWKW